MQVSNERRLAIASRAAGLGIWEWDLLADTLDYSDKAKEIFGFSHYGELQRSVVLSAIHPDDRSMVQQQSARALDPLVRANEPYRYRIVRPEGDVRWVLAHGEAVFEAVDGKTRATSYIGTFQDVTEQYHADQRVQRSEERLRLAMEAGGIALWELDMAAQTVTPSPEFNALFGFPADASPTLADLHSRYAPGERERLQQLGQEARERGEDQIQAELRLVMPGGEPKWLYLRAHAAPPVDGSGPRAIGVVMDITERKVAEERLAIVARELQHRVKNSITVIQTIASQTFRGDRSAQESLQVFSGRLRALAAATDVIAGEEWRGIELGDVVKTVLAPYRDKTADPFRVTGAPEALSSALSTSIAMALHELSTNAAKYGALSTPQGSVQLSWERRGERLHVEWKERGGPPVSVPTRTGFGTRLLERGLFVSPAGELLLAFEPDGLRAQISVDMLRNP